VLHAFGEEVTIHLDMWTALTPPGGGPPPHYHLNEDEAFHILEGRVAFLLNEEWNEIGPGGTAFMPRGIVHTFKNVGDEPSRMLIITAPSGFEKFFARCAAEFAELDKPDMWRLAEIGAEHGIHSFRNRNGESRSQRQRLQ
jgi:mannose-6-phosphate isomerase-like protein (cupin superfamily)